MSQEEPAGYASEREAREDSLRRRRAWERLRELEREHFALELEAIGEELGASGFDFHRDGEGVSIWPRWGGVHGADAARALAWAGAALEGAGVDARKVERAKERADEALASLAAIDPAGAREIAASGPLEDCSRLMGWMSAVPAASAPELCRMFGWAIEASQIERARIGAAAPEPSGAERRSGI